MHNSRPVNTPGTEALTATDNEAALRREEHRHYRSAVGKLQWMTYTGPDICYAAKELARDLKRLKHLLRYLEGATSLKYIVVPASTPNRGQVQVDVYTDADWAGCPTTRESTSGFVIQVAGTTVHIGFGTQSGTLRNRHGSNRSLTRQECLRRSLSNATVMTRIHTDSTAGKSIATRIGSSTKEHLTTSQNSSPSTPEHAHSAGTSTVLAYMVSTGGHNSQQSKQGYRQAGNMFVGHTRQ